MDEVLNPKSVVEAWDALIPLVAAVEARLGKTLRRYGLGQSEFRALGVMEAMHDNEVRLLDLADEVGLDRSSVSRLVTRLEDGELVRRESCGDDRRGVYIILTDAGRGLYRTAYDSYARTLTETFRTLALPEEALGSLISSRRVAQDL